MTTFASRDETVPPASGWLRFAALLLGVALVDLPIDGVPAYALLAAMAVLIFTGELRTSARAWLAVLIVVALAVAGQMLLAPPRIDEGHNVFLPNAPVLQGLPGEVHAALSKEFDALYPPDKRCDPKEFGCWQGQGLPDRLYAFSADGIWHKSGASRTTDSIDFSDPVWLRLGFINELRYNWTAGTDVKRGERDRSIWAGLHRWRLTMPWFEMIRLPAAYVGGELCWRGDLMWEGAGERFSRWPGDSCRTIESADAGRRIFGLAITPDALAMRLTPPWSVRLIGWAQSALSLIAAFALIAMLVRIDVRRAALPLAFIVLAVVMIVLDDGTFLGGVRPFDGGDDGLFYDGIGRIMLQKLFAGDVRGALEGVEPVFYYGGPGLRYFRVVEHIVFGETYLGYLSLILLLPILLWRLFRRFLPEPWPLALTFIFIAVPVGALFGTTFVNYTKWAARGFADPLAYTLFVAGLGVVIGARGGPGPRFAPAFFGALLLVLGLSMKPIVAPCAAVLLAGCGLAALAQRQWARVAGLCLGTLPVFWMALHNWVFGHKLVLFSSNSANSDLLVIPPSAYVAAVRQLATGDAGGLAAIAHQLAHWLSGPFESYWTIPLNAGGVAILLYVVLRGRSFDPWLRLVGGAALTQHAVAFFYNAAIGRYHFLTWLLTMLVATVWLHDVGVSWLVRRYPLLCARIVSLPTSRWLVSGLARLQKVSA